MNTFEFCGKIALGKETEKFKPIEVRTFDSGWTNTTLRFNCISDTNRVLCLSQGGKWKDDKKNSIKTFSKTVKDENGNVIKGENITIPWDQRFDKEQIGRVAGFKKFVCDLGDLKTRYALQNLVKAFESNGDTDALVEQTGIDNLEDAKDALERSWAKRKEFLAECDFTEYLIKVCQSEKMRDKRFNISGSYDVQYNPVNGKFYTNYHVNRVTLAADDAEPSTKMEIDFFFGEDAWDDSVYEETGKCFINGWVTYYDSNKEIRNHGFKPITITVKEDEKKVRGLKRKFDTDEKIKQIGLTLKVIEGAERKEITIEMLDDETREDIECGLLSFDDVKKALGGNTFGDRISELRYVELTATKNIVKDTIYSIDDMHPAKKKAAAKEESRDVAQEINDIMKDMESELPFDLDDDL